MAYYAKAKALYAWLPLSALPFPYYPHLGSTLWMFVLSWVGPDFESMGRLFFPFAYLFWVLGLVELSYRRYPLAAAVLLPVVAVLFFDFEFYTNGYQDGFVMAAAGMSATLMAKTLSNPCSAEPLSAGGLHTTPETSQWRQDCYLASFLAGMLGLIKQEGAVFGAILMTLWIAGLAARGRRSHLARLFRQVVRITVVYVLAEATWPLLRLSYGIPQTPFFFTPASVIHALGQVDRFYAIYPYMAAYYVQLRPVLWACVVLSVGAIMVAPRVRVALAFLWGVGVLHSSFVVLIFLSTQAPLEWHLQTAFARLMSQHVFVFGTIMCVTLFVLLASLSAPRLPGTRQVGEGEEAPASG